MEVIQLESLPIGIKGGSLLLLGLLLIFACLTADISGRDVYARYPRPSNWLWRKYTHEVVQEGYIKIIKRRQSPFVVKWWAKDYLILPSKYLQDLKSADWSHLSFFRNISDALWLHTTVGDMYASNRMVQVVTRGLNPLMPILMPGLDEETSYAIKAEIGDAKEWVSLPAGRTLIAISHRSATRFMIGREVCRDELFVRSSAAFVESIFTNALVIVKLPLGPLRDLLAPLLSYLHGRKLNYAAGLLVPLIQKRITANAGRYPGKSLDAIGWTLAFPSRDARQNEPDYLARELLHGLWAGSSAPGGMMCEILYQLLMMPQYLEPLRVEAEEALSANNGWNDKMLDSLPRLDSFIREVNRMYPIGAMSVSRTVLDQPFTFSDGLTLPVGTRFSFPNAAIQSDPDVYRDPDIFNGFRTVDHGHSKESENMQAGRSSASSVSPNYLPFGYGNHACPGRFWAIRTIKMVIVKLILEYEMQWPHAAVIERPSRLVVEGQFVPNLDQKVEFRKRHA